MSDCLIKACGAEPSGEGLLCTRCNKYEPWWHSWFCPHPLSVAARSHLDSLNPTRGVSSRAAQADDPVNNPSHYASGAVECIDAIQASMSVEAFRGYCKGTIEAYVWRYEHKGGVEDLRKAEWYLKRLLATFDAVA